MTVWAELDGHRFDLQALAGQFPVGDPRVVRDEDGTFMLSGALDDVFDNGGHLMELAQEVLIQLNGWMVLSEAGYRPVSLRGKFRSDREPHVQHIVVSDEARVRDTVSLTVTEVGGGNDAPAPTVPRPGPRHLARSDQNVKDLLAVVGKDASLSWSQLYKALEIIKDAVGGGNKGLVTTGWTTNVELTAFTASANNHDVSGLHGSRHARASGGVPKRTQTLEQAQAYIRDLSQEWLDSLP